jgi:hypothetical protein
MADRRTPSFILLVLSFLLPGFLPGQEPEYTEAAEHFTQRLVWEKTEYTYRYEITVEMENSSGEYAEIHRESRTENFIELSLAPGLYRYRIEAYNLLNRSAGFSAWIRFRVLPAMQPELYSFTQEFLPSGEEYPQGATELILHGANLMEGMEVYLKPVEAGGNPILPLACFPSGESVRLVFGPETPEPGRYRIYVRNPGGLESSLEINVSPAPLAAADTPAVPPVPGSDSGADTSPVTPPVSGDTSPIVPPVPYDDFAPLPRRPSDIYFSVEYSPLISLYGDLFDRLKGPLYPVGASARIACLFFKPSWGDLGLELSPSWNALEADPIKISMETLHLNGVYQWLFHGQMTAFIFRSGAGINFIHGTNSGNQNTGSIFTWVPSVSGGIAFRRFVHRILNSRQISYRIFYLELGVEYTHVFSADSPQPGYVKPALDAGWRF